MFKKIAVIGIVLIIGGKIVGDFLGLDFTDVMNAGLTLFMKVLGSSETVNIF